MRHADRPTDHSPSASRCAGTGWESRTKSGHFSIVPLLLFNRDISAEARRALVESRLRDAAEMLMHEHGLSCIEAGDLLGVAACYKKPIDRARAPLENHFNQKRKESTKYPGVSPPSARATRKK